MNVVLVILDTLRQDHLGAYGNEWIRVPHWDAFARESMRFTRAYSEALPTVPVRRTMHTGRRVYPFHGHREYKGVGAAILGWSPNTPRSRTPWPRSCRRGVTAAP